MSEANGGIGEVISFYFKKEFVYRLVSVLACIFKIIDIFDFGVIYILHGKVVRSLVKFNFNKVS